MPGNVSLPLGQLSQAIAWNTINHLTQHQIPGEFRGAPNNELLCDFMQSGNESEKPGDAKHTTEPLLTT